MAEQKRLEVPELSLVVLIGASGSGKSTFARTHFLPTEVVSSDFCRGLVADDENDQSATKDAFELLHFIAGKRMEGGRLTVVDATSVKREDRAPLVTLARKHHFLPVAIVFNLPERLCQDRNRDRPERDFGLTLDLYRAGRLPLDRLVSHRLPLGEIARGFELMQAGEALRVVLDLGNGAT